MVDAEKRAQLDALRDHVARICAGNGVLRDFRQLEPRPVPNAGAPEPLRPKGPHVPFGRWLLQQTGNNVSGSLDGDGGFRAELLAYAMADPRFPKEGSPEDVRKRLREVMADGDMFAAVDDAELDWACW